MIAKLEIPSSLSWLRQKDALADGLERALLAMLRWSDSVRSGVVEPYSVPVIRTSRCVARIGELARFDTTMGDITVLLPSVSPENAGRSLILKVTSGGNDVIAFPQPTNTIGGASSLTISDSAMLVSDGASDWSAH